MKTAIKKRQLTIRRRFRIRNKVTGDATRPRLTVHFSNKHIYAQAIDDERGHTVAYASSLDKDLRGEKLTANLAGAEALGKRMAEKARSAGIEQVVFDRNGRRYHGAVKAFADAARAGGLQF